MCTVYRKKKKIAEWICGRKFLWNAVNEDACKRKMGNIWRNIAFWKNKNRKLLNDNSPSSREKKWYEATCVIYSDLWKHICRTTFITEHGEICKVNKSMCKLVSKSYYFLRNIVLTHSYTNKGLYGSKLLLWFFFCFTLFSHAKS